jgi:hypothetical protein
MQNMEIEMIIIPIVAYEGLIELFQELHKSIIQIKQITQTTVQMISIRNDVFIFV